MFKKILVPTDGSALSEKAVHAAIQFAKLNEGQLIALCVAEPYLYTPLSEAAASSALDVYESQTKKFASLHVQKVADMAAESNVKCEAHIAVSFSPYEEIVRAADQHHCDAIFMASHGRKGLNKLFLGSETQKVLAHTTIPVMIFR